MRRHGIPEAILTDNGKVFTNRFGRGNGEVLFDRICRENGIRHLLTAPRSPTTTGKVERFHKTLKSEGIAGQTFADLAAAQAAVDAWVEHYNHQRPHQGIGMVAPIRRFELAAVSQREAIEAPPRPPEPELEHVAPLMATRRVNRHGIVSFAAANYHVARWLAGQTVRISIEGELVSFHHRGVLVATHARTHDPARERAALARQISGRKPRKREASRPDHPVAASSDAVTRKVDTTGSISFAAASYRVGSAYRARQQVQVAIVDDQVQIAFEGTVIRTARSVTTPPANTAPSPTPPAEPTASTPHDRRTATGPTPSRGYRNLNRRSSLMCRSGSWLTLRLRYVGDTSHPGAHRTRSTRTRAPRPSVVGPPIATRPAGAKRWDSPEPRERGSPDRRRSRPPFGPRSQRRRTGASSRVLETLEHAEELHALRHVERLEPSHRLLGRRDVGERRERGVRLRQALPVVGAQLLEERECLVDGRDRLDAGGEVVDGPVDLGRGPSTSGTRARCPSPRRCAA